MGKTQIGTGTQFTYKKFQESLSLCGVLLELVAQYHNEMSFQVEGTWQTLRTITHSIMVDTRVSDEYTHFH